MINDTMSFLYEDHDVRTIKRDGNPWFVAKDVTTILGLKNPTRVLSALDDDEKGLHTVNTPGGNQVVSIVSESGLYSLILRSRKPEARAFKRWVTHEVLPAIRSTGVYHVPDIDPLFLRQIADKIESEYPGLESL